MTTLAELKPGDRVQIHVVNCPARIELVTSVDRLVFWAGGFAYWKRTGENRDFYGRRATLASLAAACDIELTKETEA